MASSKPSPFSSTSTAAGASSSSEPSLPRDNFAPDEPLIVEAVPLEPPFHDFAEVSRNLQTIANSIIGPLCERHGLNRLALFSLIHLAKAPDQLPSHLSGVLHAKRTNIASTLRALERKGLVTIGANAQDKRQRLVNLTDKGFATAADVEEELETARIRLTDPIDPARLERMTEAWEDFRSIVAEIASAPQQANASTPQ